MVAVAGAGFRPGTQLHHALRLSVCRRRINRHVARPLQHPVINHHVAGNQQPCPTIGPTPIKRFMPLGSVQLIICQPFGHGGLGKSVREDSSAGECQGLGEGRYGHKIFLRVLSV
jgi:hypothetical protein